MHRFCRDIALALVCAVLGAWSQAAPVAASGAVVDRIRATVNGRVLTESELDDAAWFALFSAYLRGGAPPPPAQLDAATERRALRHLIDETLVAEAGAASAPPASAAEIAGQMDALEARAGGAAAFGRQAARYHLSPMAVRRIVREQLTLLQFLDHRFAASVHVEPADVDRYYRESYSPLAARRGIQPEPLSRAAPAIRAILQQRQLASLEENWLAALRANAHIVVFTP